MATILDTNEVLATHFEPKLQSRFILYMDGFQSYTIKSVNGIGFEQGEVMINYINSYYKLKGGRLVWNDITLGLYDPITPSGSQAVMEWVRMHHETLTGRSGYFDMYAKNLTLAILGPVGDVVSEFLIKLAFIKSGNLGDWDWDNQDAPQELSLTLGNSGVIHNF